MVTLVFGPRGVPASYRTMQGFGVNTYKWVNEAGETKLVKYHWHPKQGVKSWTEDGRRRSSRAVSSAATRATSTRRSSAASTRSGTSSSS